PSAAGLPQIHLASRAMSERMYLSFNVGGGAAQTGAAATWRVEICIQLARASRTGKADFRTCMKKRLLMTPRKASVSQRARIGNGSPRHSAKCVLLCDDNSHAHLAFVLSNGHPYNAITVFSIC